MTSVISCPPSASITLSNELHKQIFTALSVSPPSIKDPLDWKQNTISKPPDNLVKLYACVEAIQTMEVNMKSFFNTLRNTPPKNLQWTSAMHAPIEIPSVLQDNYADQMRVWQKKKGKTDALSACFDIYHKTPHYDQKFSYYIASLFDPSCSMLEGAVADTLLQTHKHDSSYTLQSFEQDMLSWKDRELTHVWMIAAKCMPTTEHWLSTNQRVQACLTALNESSDWKSSIKIMKDFSNNVSDNHFLATLGYIQYLLSPQPLKLRSVEGTCVDLMCNFVSFMEQEVPLFLLCPDVYGYLKETLGYKNLQLQYNKKNDSFAFSKQTMQVLHNKSDTKQIAVSNSNIIFKFAGLMTSSDMIDLMVHGSIQGKRNASTAENLQVLRKTPLVKKAVQEKIDKIQEDMLQSSPVIKIDHDSTFVGWKLEAPKKNLIPVSVPVGHSLATPHLLGRTFMEGSSSGQIADSGFVVLQNDRASASVSSHVKNCMHTRYATKKMYSVNTAFHESIACMVLFDAPMHTRVCLHGSQPWEGEVQDMRYAETQQAAGGSGRYRDWCNLSSKVKGKNMLKSRLDSHVIHQKSSYRCNLPCISNNEVKWLSVLSSLPLPLMVLQLSPNNNDSMLHSIVQAVNNKFKHNLHLFPVQDKSFTVSKDNVHVYKDDEANAVTLVYSSEEDKQNKLNYMLFTV